MASDNIRELFKPLAQRLAIIEGQRADRYSEHLSLLDPIAEKLMALPESDTIPEIERFIKLIGEIINIGHFNAKLIDESLPFEVNIDNDIITELKNYIATLQSFIEKVKAYINEPINAVNIQKKVIELAGDIKAADYKGIFESKLTTQEVALLLYLLQLLGHIPEYTPNSLGNIALVLFAKSQNTVKQAIGDITERNTIRAEDLRSLKKHLTEIISTIDSNIKRLERQAIMQHDKKV